MEKMWLFIGILLSVAGGFGLFRQITFLFGQDFYDVREDINDSCGGCFFVSTYIAAALLTPLLYLLIGVYVLIIILTGGKHWDGGSDFTRPKFYLILAIGWTFVYCCLIAPFSSCLFACCFIGDEDDEIEEGKKAKSERVAAFTGGMQKTMFDPNSEYFTQLGKKFKKGGGGRGAMAPEDM